MYLAFCCSKLSYSCIIIIFQDFALVGYNNVWIYFGFMFGYVWILFVLLSSFWCCQRGRELERAWVRNQLELSKIRHTCQKIGGVRVVWTCYHIVYSLSWFQGLCVYVCVCVCVCLSVCMCNGTPCFEKLLWPTFHQKFNSINQNDTSTIFQRNNYIISIVNCDIIYKQLEA